MDSLSNHIVYYFCNRVGRLSRTNYKDALPLRQVKGPLPDPQCIALYTESAANCYFRVGRGQACLRNVKYKPTKLNFASRQ